MDGSWGLQVSEDGPLAESSTPLQAPIMQQAHGVTTNNGDFNLAGRDLHVHKHYHSYPDRVDITAILDGIRNLRKVHLDVLSKATEGTGVWLLRNEKFLIWLDPNGNLKIMWGIGIPGAGKTVLASIVIRDLEARAEAAGGKICVCYVYIRYSDGADLTVRNVLEILVKQTVERHPDCALMAEKAYARHLREKTQPTEAELLQLQRQFTEAIAATFYILDALDEAPDRIQVDLVLKLASLNVRLFITSRPLEVAPAQAPNSHYFPIVAQEYDLNLHINQEIDRSRSLANLLEKAGSSLRDQVVSLVKSRCGGMFLHASLQVDALCDCTTALEVRQTLHVFPSRIEDVYLQTWHRILEQKPNHVLLAKTTLVWVLNASRSMTIDELERAVATSPNTFKFEADRLAPGTTLIAFCCGLVTFEEESRLVRLIIPPKRLCKDYSVIRSPIHTPILPGFASPTSCRVDSKTHHYAPGRNLMRLERQTLYLPMRLTPGYLTLESPFTWMTPVSKLRTSLSDAAPTQALPTLMTLWPLTFSVPFTSSSFTTCPYP
ncbi:hypothetical protein BKA70DRAFT_176867 [Coprinopsis sp. MPI-PUGE-AT-0042]|nr:hypothetical protein BKA70DRAFT_176867 [Coprinopsis sp. MPI-PUGE-AT-0042]